MLHYVCVHIISYIDTGTKNESTQVEQPPPAYTKYPVSFVIDNLAIILSIWFCT